MRRNNNLKININNFKKVYIIIAFFIVFFLVIVSKLFSYTVMNYDFYKGLADSQQIGKVTLPVNRGTIYSSGEKNTILSTSLNLYDVAIDPDIKGDKEKLSEFLTDIVYMETCEKQNFTKCKSNLLKFLRVLELEDFNNSEKYVKEKIKERIVSKVSQTKVTSVLVTTGLSEQKIQDLVKLGIAGVYPSKSNLYVNPEEFNQNELNLLNLSDILNISVENLKTITRKRKLRYVPILNKLSINTSEYIKNYIEEEREVLMKGIIDKEDTIYGFFILTPKPNRYYPENSLASQVIGFVDNEGVGHYGIEGHFDDILKGNKGKIVSRKDIKGRIIDPISLNQIDLIGEGVQINTTIDRNIQKKVEEILEYGVYKYRANRGSVVIMNPKTGEIISMANYPSYDLNNYGDVYELEKVKYSKYPTPETDLLGFPIYVEDKENGKKFYYDNKEIYLREAEREELGDRALVKYKYVNDYGAQVYKNDVISSLYEPGSIMKSITVAIGLDTGEINPSSMYMDKGSVSIDEFEIKNVSDKCLGYHSFGHALNYSCNVGMIRIVQRLGKVLFHQYMKEFGFDNVTGINLQGEVYSQLKPWERWSTAQLLTSSYGLGISVTPLQMAGAYSVLANDGIYIKPKIIDEIVYPDGKVVKYKTEKQRRVLKEETSEIITDMLVDSATNGAAKNGYVEGYLTAGKTGTSQIAYKGKYEKGVASTYGSYAGYGPAEDPKFVVIVKLERPRVSEYGGATSAYIFKDIVEYLYDYYGIPKKNIKN